MVLLGTLRSRRARVAVTAVGVCAALVWSSVPTSAGAETVADRAPTPGDQPLPGYTVRNPALAPLTVRGERTTVLQGVRRHAAYDIEIPPDWNGQLVMWAHGYRGPGRQLTVDVPDYGLRARFARQGYAWAASSYARNDYDVATGVRTTHDLAQYAARVLPRRPSRTYVAGVSMGGHVIGRSLEQYPRFYAGALPMCGVLGDQELFDYFLGYNLAAQDLADVPAYPPPADYQSAVVPTIQQKLGLAGLQPGGPDTTNDLGKQLRRVTTELTGGPRPGSQQAFAVWKDFLFSLATPDNGARLSQNPGRIAQDLDTVFRPSTPVDLESTVQRVAPADPAARGSRALTQIPRITGRPRVPTLTLHGLGDLFVPFSMEQVYRREVRSHGQEQLIVQREIRAAGHCEFTPAEVGRAWDDLTRWVESRDRGGRVAHPAGDRILPRSSVASATFGCRFTDPAGYDAPRRYPTRALYRRCPR